MFKFVQALETELNECGKEPLFEIEVVTSKGEANYILCDIFFEGNTIKCHRDPVSKQEAKSKFVASTSLVCDSALSLDDHLTELYSAILADILAGDLYDLPSN